MRGCAAKTVMTPVSSTGVCPLTLSRSVTVCGPVCVVVGVPVSVAPLCVTLASDSQAGPETMESAATSLPFFFWKVTGEE